MGRYRCPVLEPHREWLLDQVQTCPYVTLAILQEMLAERRVEVSHDAVRRFLLCCGFCLIKKTLVADERERPNVKRRRERLQGYQGRIDPTRLVFIHETWVKTNMAPLRGRALKGERLPGAAPFDHCDTSTCIAALRYDRIDAPWVFDGPVNGDVFKTYVEHELVPALKPGDVKVMDNLGSHKSRLCARQSEWQARTCCSCRPTVRTLASLKSIQRIDFYTLLTNRTGFRQAQKPEA